MAGEFLELQPLLNYYAEHFVPKEPFSIDRNYVTNGTVSFDFHGYSVRGKLISHHYGGGLADIEAGTVKFTGSIIRC